MRLKLKNTPEQVELVKAIGSRDQNVAREASEAFATFLGPVIQKVLLSAGTASAIYSDSEYDEDDSPSYPVDLYYGDGAGHVSTWSQTVAGGLPTSHVTGMQEVKIATYRLDTAVSFLKRYARRARLDIVSKALERMAQEMLVKQERNAWAVIMKALVDAETNTSKVGTSGLAKKHVIAQSAGGFTVDKMNGMLTLIKRINESWSGNTAVAPYSSGMTDLYLSPEVMQAVRAFAYQPIYTGTNTEALPENVRDGVWKASGMSSIYGINLVEMTELGVDKKYDKLFDTLNTAASTPHTFTQGTHEILVGIDNSRGAFIRPVARQHDSGGTFSAVPDDQWVSRSEKTGFYGFLEEGRICIDARSILGLII
jgi:hypothetical protein